MARSEPTPVDDITVPVSEPDPVDAMAPVTLPEQDSDAPPKRDRNRKRLERRQAEVPDSESEAVDEDGDEEADESLFAPARRPGRRAVRVIRRVQLWSVFKVALLGGLVFYAIFLIATALGWSIANATGQIHHIEQFMRQVGFDSWTFNGAQLFRAAALSGAIALVAGSILITLGAAIVNLIAEATGGIRFTVIEVTETDEDDVADDRDLGGPSAPGHARRSAGPRHR